MTPSRPLRTFRASIWPTVIDRFAARVAYALDASAIDAAAVKAIIEDITSSE